MVPTARALGLAVLTLAAAGSAAQPFAIEPLSPPLLGSAITYQGRLGISGSPATGSYDFQFTLFNGLSASVGQVTKLAVPVSAGIFTVELDFGFAAFPGEARYLEIAVRPANSGGYTTLAPRQPVDASPYALLSKNLSCLGCVFPAYLSALGSTSGQALTSNGSTVSWQYPALGLPFTGSVAANGATAFKVTNSGTSIGDFPVGVFGAGTSGIGVRGAGGSGGVYGSLDAAPIGALPIAGVTGEGGSSAPGVWGTSSSTAAGIGGVKGSNVSGTGVYGGSSSSFGVYGISSTGSAVGGESNNVGVFAHNLTNTGNTAYLGANCCGADLYGPTAIHGPLTKPGGSFKIDHPLDPANRYLSHSFVESPDMKNIYDGVVRLDARGEAEIQLPDWFEALNEDFRYQLTAIGRPAPDLYVAQEIRNGRFRVAGGSPGQKVSWQVTGIRHDAWANAHRIVVDEPKPASERGTYENPELFGQPPERGLERARHGEDGSPSR